ncbi:MAG TPA: hypothetical protein VMF89_34630, partial [Polyangiales bacterium]|nr:hypothetical protein [Polyangiales bacterium]
MLGSLVIVSSAAISLACDAFLVGLRTVPHESGPKLIAYGPSGTPVLVRDSHGAWSPPSDEATRKELAAHALEGPPLSLPADCVRHYWRWMDAQGGLAVCRDLRAFASRDGQLLPLQKMPKACDMLGDVAQRGSEIFARCGNDGRVLRFAEGKWSPIAGLKQITALGADEKCVLATTKRTVLR